MPQTKSLSSEDEYIAPHEIAIDDAVHLHGLHSKWGRILLADVCVEVSLSLLEIFLVRRLLDFLKIAMFVCGSGHLPRMHTDKVLLSYIYIIKPLLLKYRSEKHRVIYTVLWYLLLIN